MMKKMKITLLKDGTQKVEVLNAVGDECEAFTQALENRLGTPLGERTLKPEYYETVTETELEHEVER
jgi:phage baseplate assembly protein W